MLNDAKKCTLNQKAGPQPSAIFDGSLNVQMYFPQVSLLRVDLPPALSVCVVLWGLTIK